MNRQNKLSRKSLDQLKAYIENIKEADAKTSAFPLLPTFFIEKILTNNGFKLIAGVDEAGRGALAGPLSLGLSIYSSDFIMHPESHLLEVVNDSKKLTPAQRETAYESVLKCSVYTGSAFSSHRKIDRRNVNLATEDALNRCIKQAEIKPDIIIMDGNFSFDLDIPIISIKRGDSKSISIASASIIAKVKRDRTMERLDKIFPGYGFCQNKGYGTKKHLQSLRESGHTRIHRKSYEPLKDMLSGKA